MRNYALCAAFALVLGTGAAFAEHAIEPGQAIEADQAVETPQAVETEAPDGETIVTGITREVCTVSDWGLGEVRRECLTEVLPPRQSDHAAKGVCMIKYGVRTCY